jgi:hypothetical protein
MPIMHENRVYQTEKLQELLDDSKTCMRRFVLTKDVAAYENTPGWHRYHADGIEFYNGTIVLFHTGAMHTSGVEVYPTLKDMMISSYAHEYEVHWLDIPVKEATDGTA